MQRLLFLIMNISMLGILSAAAQELPIPVTETLSDNVDSLIADSVRKAFILNHRPLTLAEINGIGLKQGTGFYGAFVADYMGKEFYRVIRPANRQFVSKRNIPRLEWIFYCFSLLFLVFGLVNLFFNAYLKKLFRVFAHEGFVYRQAKDQMGQSSFAALSLNILFLLTGTVFVFFGLGGNNLFTGMDRWQLMLLVFSFFLLVYVFKYLFLKFLGWVLNQKESFENYIFVVFLNNKLSGMLMLLASFMMAFSEKGVSLLVFKTTLYLLGALVFTRLFRGFQVFSKQSKIGFFSFSLAVFALEVLPTAVMLKFVSDGIRLVIDGFI